MDRNEVEDRNEIEDKEVLDQNEIEGESLPDHQDNVESDSDEVTIPTLSPRGLSPKSLRIPKILERSISPPLANLDFQEPVSNSDVITDVKLAGNRPCKYFKRDTHKDGHEIPIYKIKIIIVPQQPFQWDGSDLGTITKKQISAHAIYKQTTFWRLTILNYESIGIVRSIKSLEPIIVDEMKSIFGLNKTGTHYFTYNNQLYIFMEARLGLSTLVEDKERIVAYHSNVDIKKLRCNICIQGEKTLDYLPPCTNKAFKKAVREYYTYRDILGVTCTRDSSFLIRHRYIKDYQIDETYGYPLSFIEPEIAPFAASAKIADSVFIRWFDEIPVGSVLRVMMNVRTLEEVPDRLEEYISKMREVIRRIDSKAEWLLQYIRDRMAFRLMANFDYDESHPEIFSIVPYSKLSQTEFPPPSPAFEIPDCKTP